MLRRFILTPAQLAPKPLDEDMADTEPQKEFDEKIEKNISSDTLPVDFRRKLVNANVAKRQALKRARKNQKVEIRENIESEPPMPLSSDQVDAAWTEQIHTNVQKPRALQLAELLRTNAAIGRMTENGDFKLANGETMTRAETTNAFDFLFNARLGVTKEIPQKVRKLLDGSREAGIHQQFSQIIGNKAAKNYLQGGGNELNNQWRDQIEEMPE